MCAVGNHFIDVHIALGATAGLPHHQRKLVVQFAFQYFIANLCNCIGFFLWQCAYILVG